MLETLEQRRLLAGVTLLAHGLNGNIDGWVAKAADAIVERAGGPSAASVYTMKLVKDGSNFRITRFAKDSGYADFRETSQSELIIRLDWNSATAITTPVQNVAKALADYLAEPHGDVPALATLPLHLIGHSRGAALVSQLARHLGKRNIIVDHLTMLDPIPVAGLPSWINNQFGDGSIDAWDNVVFGDTYWRDGGAEQKGSHIKGTYNGDLNNSVGEHYLVSQHNAVTAYYVGTIDLTATTGGDHPIYSDWYGNTASKPARDQTGFYFSRLAGGTRHPTGLGPLGGGSASRESTGQSGTQWPGAVEIKPRAGTSFNSGARFNVNLRAGDRDGQATANFFLDTDRNPFNGPGTQIATTTIQGAVGDYIVAARAAGVLPGTYALAVQLTDAAGQTRWTYGRSISITEPTPFGSISGRILTLNGTEGGDGIAISRDGDSLVAQLNGGVNTFNLADFDLIQIFAGDGDDIVTFEPDITTRAYVDGGAGNDRITTGAGNDTITGGAGKNTLTGGAGDDRINGSGGRDLIFGGDGADRLYGNAGDDTLDGGGGVDRAWGGEGNDLLIGGGGNDKLFGEGGDDTLIGRAGADFLDGGDGVDSADDDPTDSRLAVEVLL